MALLFKLAGVMGCRPRTCLADWTICRELRTVDGTIEELLSIVRLGKNLRTLRRTGQTKIDSALKPSTITKFSGRFEARERLIESIEYHLLSTGFSFFDRDATGRSPSIGDWIGSLVAGGSVYNILLQISRNAVGSWHGLLMGQPVDHLNINANTGSVEFTHDANGISFTGKLENDEIKGKAASINNRIKKDVTFEARAARYRHWRLG